MPVRWEFRFDEDSLELETWKLSVLKLFPNSAISSAQNSPLEREILIININFTLIDCITSRITWRGCNPISGTPLASERRLGSLFQPRTSQCQSSLSHSKVFPKCEIDSSTQTGPVLIFFFPRWQSTSCSKVNFSISQNNSKQLLRNLIFTSFKRFSKQPLYSVQCKPTTEILENLFWDDEGRTWHCFGSTHKNS